MSDLDQAAPRRRGRPAKQQAAEHVQTAENAEAHVAVRQQRQYLDHKGKKVDEWFEFLNNKLLKKQRYENGNVYTHYIESLKPMTKDPKRKQRNEQLKEKIAKLKAEGKMRVGV